MSSPTLTKEDRNEQSLMLLDIDRKLDKNSSYFGKKYDSSNRKNLCKLSATNYWDMHPYIDVSTLSLVSLINWFCIG